MWAAINLEFCGRGHLKDNIPCQDKTYFLKRNNVYVSALADGAGSAKYSHFGAEIASRSICEYLADNFNIVYNSEATAVKQTIIDTLTTQLKIKADGLKCEIKELASTLLAIAIYEDTCIIAHIGDGLIGCMHNGKLQILSFPNNGEYSNSTYFTTTANAIKYIELKKGNIADISGIVLMSDGTCDSFYSKANKTLSDGITKIFKRTILLNDESALKLLKDNFSIVIDNTDDDCSMVTMVRKSNDLRLYNELTIGEKIALFDIKAKNRIKKKWIKRIDAAIDIISNGQNKKSEICKKLKTDVSFANKYFLKPLYECGIISGENEISLNIRK
jgi:hypothetical protein